MKYSKRFLVALGALGLSGCASNGGGIGQVGSPLWSMTTTNEQKLEVYRANCIGYGFTPDNENFPQCIMLEKQRTEDLVSSGWQSFSNTTRSMGSMYDNKSINCTSYSLGRNVNTTCTQY